MKNTELEIKYLFGKKDIKKIKKAIENIDGILKTGRFYEKTVMFDNKSKIMDNEDARLRVREISKTKKNTKICIEFSYKKRVRANGGIKKEEEIELSFEENPGDLHKILYKMGFVPITSYERHRETYKTDENDIKITIDEFPFGYILEIEGNEKNIKSYNNKLKLNIKDSYPLSCDDVYVELCQRYGVTPKDNILFDDSEMPQIK